MEYGHRSPAQNVVSHIPQLSNTAVIDAIIARDFSLWIQISFVLPLLNINNSFLLLISLC